MGFHPFDTTIPHITYACLGGFTVIFGMFSLFLREKLYIGEACWAFLFGVVIGPYGTNVFNPRGWGHESEEVTNMITLEFTRVVLAIGVFAIGVELPKAYMARHWKSLLFLLVPVMTWGWFVSAALIYALIPGLNFLSSLAVAACLTPTDPILAAAVVGGKYADKHVPAHIRHLLAAESGCNDGAAFPFLYIALYLILDAPDEGKAVRDWFLLLWLYQIVLGVVLGSLIGLGFRYLMKFCESKELIDRHSYVAQYVSLALLTIGITTMLGSDDLLAAFCCGTAFAWDGFFNRQTEESVFSSVIDLLFNVAAFVFVGAWMPFGKFSDEVLTLTVWRLIVIAILVLLLRRLPVVVALYKWIPDIKTFREAIFSGHFGPIGIGAVFISTLAVEKLAHHEYPPTNQTELLAASIQPIVAFMVLCSITVHGLSIPGFSLGRRVHSVSRTWSRHAPPDWTTQARHVERGDDIVINRDSEMERGELSADEKLAANQKDSDTNKSGTPTKNIDGEGSNEEKKMESILEMKERKKEENPPDGDETVLEWKEGNDQVIERRSGPGKEVEVEVVRNAFTDDETVTSAFKGHEPTVRRIAAAHMNILPHVPHEPAKNIKNDGERMVEGAEEVEHTRTSHSEDEEEGWASDRSGGSFQGGSSLKPVQSNSTTGSGQLRSKSPRKKTCTKPAKPVGLGKGKRRNSIRRGLLGHAHRLMSSPVRNTADSDSDEEDPGRGRKVMLDPVPSSRPSTARSSVRHFRIDSLSNSRPRTREVSPARSVRFADEDRPRSGTSTPLHSVFPLNGDGVSVDDADAGKTRVTFDLPRPSSAK